MLKKTLMKCILLCVHQFGEAKSLCNYSQCAFSNGIFVEHGVDELHSPVSWCCGNHCWFAFVLWFGYCLASFQSFASHHLVIAPVCNTKKKKKRINLRGDNNTCVINQVSSENHGRALGILIVPWENCGCTEIRLERTAARSQATIVSGNIFCFSLSLVFFYQQFF